MEKINDILKPLLGIILIISFVMAFSSCEKKSETSDGKDTVVKYRITKDTIVKNENQQQDWKQKMKQESNDLGVELDSLKEKAKKGGKKLQQDVNQTVDKWNNERKGFDKDTTDESMKERWEEFKARTKRGIDSLKKKI